MYNRVFKNNQITYGRPYQVKLPDDLMKFVDEADDKLEGAEEGPTETSPEELLKRAEKRRKPLLPRQGQRQNV